MREMTMREANQNFSQVIAAAERGETIVITKNGTPVAKIAPQTADRTSDPEMAVEFRDTQEEPALKTTDGLSRRRYYRRRRVWGRMTRVAIGSNILIYAELEPDTAKGKRSGDLILRAARDGVISAQALGEYLRFVQRRVPAAFEEAIRQAHIYQSVFLIPSTTDDTIKRASEFARAHHL